MRVLPLLMNGLRLANFSRACPLSAYHPGLMWSWSRYESQRTEQSRSLMADITDYNKVTVKPSLRETTVQAIPALSLNSSIRAHLEQLLQSFRFLH